LEASRLANRQEGTAQDKPKVQASRPPTVERPGSKATTLTGEDEHADRRDQSEDAATPASIASKAQREGISLKPTNRSPYNRRKTAKKVQR